MFVLGTLVGGMAIALCLPALMEALGRNGGCRLPNKTSCICNLKAIEGAKGEWAFEQKKSDSDIPTWADLCGTNEYGYYRDTTNCPGGGEYVLGRVTEKPRCSIPGHTL